MRLGGDLIGHLVLNQGEHGNRIHEIHGGA
jgi:hypothetical protein